MPKPTHIAFDHQNQTIVPYRGSVVALPPFYQTNNKPFRIQSLELSGDPFAPFDEVDYAGASALRFVLSRQATGTLGDSATYELTKTVNSGWVWDAVEKCWVGNVNFNTQPIADYLAGEAEKNALLEVNVVTGGVPVTIFQSPVRLRANGDQGSVSVSDSTALINGDDGQVYALVGITVDGVMTTQLLPLYAGTVALAMINGDDGRVYGVVGKTADGVPTTTDLVALFPGTVPGAIIIGDDAQNYLLAGITVDAVMTAYLVAQ